MHAGAHLALDLALFKVQAVRLLGSSLLQGAQKGRAVTQMLPAWGRRCQHEANVANSRQVLPTAGNVEGALPAKGKSCQGHLHSWLPFYNQPRSIHTCGLLNTKLW